MIESELGRYQIAYTRVGDLGGLRARSRNVAPEINGIWQNQSLHNYADYALSDQFGAALEELLRLSSASRCAIMCAEAVWWRCHRRIIADYVLVCGRTVLHLMGNDWVETARLTPAARVRDGVITYPRD